jgi:hypothetical protein
MMTIEVFTTKATAIADTNKVSKTPWVAGSKRDAIYIYLEMFKGVLLRGVLLLHAVGWNLGS